MIAIEWTVGIMPKYVDALESVQEYVTAFEPNYVRQLDINIVPYCYVEELTPDVLHVYLDYDESQDPNRSEVTYLVVVNNTSKSLLNVYSYCQAHNIVDSDQVEIIFETEGGELEVLTFTMTSMRRNVGD